MTHQDAVDAPNLIVEVVDLEATHSLYLHLVRASLYEALDHLCSGGEKVVNWPGILWIAHLRCSSDSTDKVKGHMDLLLFDPSIEGITSPSIQVGVELTD
jgi:hypothetical protein